MGSAPCYGKLEIIGFITIIIIIINDSTIRGTDNTPMTKCKPTGHIGSIMEVHHMVFSVSLKIILKTGPNPNLFSCFRK